MRQLICGQCGQPWGYSACGPTHALMASTDYRDLVDAYEHGYDDGRDALSSANTALAEEVDRLRQLFPPVREGYIRIELATAVHGERLGLTKVFNRAEQLYASRLFDLMMRELGDASAALSSSADRTQSTCGTSASGAGGQPMGEGKNG